ncbi:hypothetical protein [Phenylobacterium sp.]|jgi:hypothetical protein|uniref:hypothetical protein n=1 Tax=Phenylobacterium sp. TaxID=1871053 RepID=UPI0037CB32F9
MNPERFEALAEAFGGDVARWPVAEREEAAVLMAAQADWAQSVLAVAGEVDTALYAYAPPKASVGLADRIVAAGPRPARGRWMGFLWPAGLGAGLAAACAAGIFVGAHLSAAIVSAEPSEAVTMAASDQNFDFDLDGEV